MSTLAYSDVILRNLEARGNDIPAWLVLGWVSVESGGKVDDNDTTVSSLGGEQGLFQLSKDERSATGFTDSALILSDPDYSTRAGLALIDYYGGRVASAGVDSSNDPLYWMLIKFAHGIGSGAMKQIVSGYLRDNGAQPSSWDDFRAYAEARPYGTLGHTQKWLDNTEKVRTRGLLLAPAAAVASALPNPETSIPILGLALTGAAAWYLLGKS